MTPEQEQKLNELYTFMLGLKNSAQLDPDVKKTIAEIVFKAGEKTADSEDVTINEGGVATKVVLNDPDGFKLGVDGKYYAYWNS